VTGFGRADAAAPIVAEFCGRERFAPCLAHQLDLRRQVVEGTLPGALVLVEHPPVLTLGRRGRRADILWPDEALARMGVEVCESPRGGEVTLHAPGQLVAYPVVRVGRKIRRHIEDLGAVAAALLATMGVAGAEFRMEHPGVWIGPRKIASIGIHVSSGVTVQGIAINLDVDRRLFGALVPCGTPGLELVSARELGVRVPPMAAAARRFSELWGERTGVPVRFVEGSRPCAPGAAAPRSQDHG